MNYLSGIAAIMMLLMPAVIASAAQPITEDHNIRTISFDSKETKGTFKAGLSIGYPFGLTAGYRVSNFFELNGSIGSDYNNIAAGVNGLFTIANLEVSREIFPLSIGPALYTHFGHHDENRKNGNDASYTSVDLLGILRIEYSFIELPVNLFVEAGFGLQVFKFTDPAGSFAVGVRYIF